ncbi:phosphoenolpyruvate-protein phosphotransferase [Spirochaetia bacterium]|nr:phosphoenolpyruvate-protein phosphotransferase [Spirochaetia bacterium]
MIFPGIPVSKGIAVGTAFVYAPFKPRIGENLIRAEEAAAHNERFNAVVIKAGDELVALQKKMAREDEDKVGIFEAHQDLLTDIAIIDEILQLINEEHYSGEYAIETVYNKYIKLFSEMDDDLMRERCADFNDVKTRILRIWMGGSQKNLSEIDVPSIVFAHDLFPSDTAALDRKKVLAIVTEIGGNTSHSAILARSFEIPALLGCNGAMTAVKNGEMVIVDAIEGNLILESGPEDIGRYSEKQKAYTRSIEEMKRYRSVEPVMKDGRRIEVCLNIGGVSNDELAASLFTDGVGLFRSEFLFMSGKELPDENQQFQVYKKAAETFGTRQVILRTLDIGGDKTLECMDLPEEDNPFLGCRALRLCFQKVDVFKTQLRASLRASVYGNLALMFPMVGSMEDLYKAKSVLEECREELRREHIPFNETMHIGIMIEIPAIAFMAERVAAEVDFASIGTNDLCQYLMAVDRLNPNVASYYQNYHPAMFGLINLVAKAFLRENKTLSICGEMGGDPMALMAFIGMGIKKFSMSASNVAAVKRMITHFSLDEAVHVLEDIQRLDTAPEIEERLKDFGEKLYT